MHKTMLKKVLGVTLGIVASIGLLSGCGGQASTPEPVTEATEATTDNAETMQASEATEVGEEAEVGEATEVGEAADDSLQAPFFTKGVYCSYEEGATTRDYFYVFYDEGAGYTEDGNGTGLPFACEQKDNKVVFSFGGEAEESKQELVVKSAENGIITGEFDEDGIELVFELLSDADPDNFNGTEYAGKSGVDAGQEVGMDTSDEED